MKSTAPTSGFTRADFILTFAIADAGRRANVAAACEAEWGGTRITESTWELATTLSPADLELALEPYLSSGDHAAYYYLASPLPDAKRLFRVVIAG